MLGASDKACQEREYAKSLAIDDPLRERHIDRCDNHRVILAEEQDSGEVHVGCGNVWVRIGTNTTPLSTLVDGACLLSK